MALIVEKLELKPVYHNLKVETPFRQDVLAGYPHVHKLVDLCSQAFEGRIQVYENGDRPYIPTEKPERRYFTIDPATDKRVEEVGRDLVHEMPMHIPTEDGLGIIPVRIAVIQEKKGERRKTEIWETDENGVLVKENGRPKRVYANPQSVIPAKTIHKFTGEEVKAFTEREIIRDEIEQLVAFYCIDLIGIPQDSEEIASEWANTYEVAPAVIGIMTDKNAHIEGVQKTHALNIVAAALRIARDPNTKVKIVSGFGASDSEPSNCYVGNALPALEMADKMRIYFEKRHAKGKKGLTHVPKVELVFAQEAGIEANFQDHPELVRTRMAENMQLVKDFIAQLYPDVLVSFNQDIPWSDLTPATLALIRYNAHLITHANSNSIRDTLEDLVASGHTKGTNGSTNETAAKYSGIHPLVWGIKPGFVPVQYLKREIPADVVVRIGPRTESKFDAMVMAIITRGNREDFIHHLLQQNLIAEVREQIISSTEKHQPEQIPINVMETARIGEHGPTYFFYDYDQPNGVTPEESVQRLSAEIASISTQIETGQRNCMTGDDLTAFATRKIVLAARVYDLQAIIRTRDNRLQTIS